MANFDWLQSLRNFTGLRQRRIRRRRNFDLGTTIHAEMLENRQLMTSQLDVVYFDVVQDDISNGTAEIRVAVTNTSDSPSPASAVAVTLSDDAVIGNSDDSRVHTVPVPALQPGETRELQSTVEFDRTVILTRSLRDDSGTSGVAESQMIDHVFANLLDVNGSPIQGSSQLHVDHDDVGALLSDVDGDGTVAPLDALAVIVGIGQQGGEIVNPRLDVNNNGIVAPLDALTVISQIGYFMEPTELVALDSTITVFENQAVTGHLWSAEGNQENVRFEIIDADDVRGSVELVNSETGEFTYTPAVGFSGNAEFTFRVTDGVNSDVAAVSLVVAGTEVIDEIQYAITSDQVIDFEGQNAFVLKTNFNDSSQILAKSSNGAVVDADDIEISSLGNGEHRVLVRHGGDDYGLSLLTFEVDEIVFADVALVVTPADDVKVTTSSNDSYEYSFETTDDGTIEIRKSFDDRFFATQVRDGVITPAQAFRLMRPSTQYDAMVARGLEGAVFRHTRELPQSQSLAAPASPLRARLVAPLASAASRQATSGPRSTVTISIPPGQGVKPRLVTPSGRPWGEAFVGHALEELNGQFNPTKNAFNLVNLTSPISAYAALGNAVLSAGVKTVFEVNPQAFGNDPAVLKNWLVGIDAASGIVGSAQAMKSLAKAATKAGATGKIVRVLRNGSATQAEEIANAVNAGIGIASAGNDANEVQRKAAQHYFEQVESFSNELVDSSATVSQSAIDVAQTGSGDTLFVEDITAIQDIHDQLNAGHEYLEAAREYVEESLANEDAVPPQPLTPTEEPDVDAAEQESTGENGDEQARINEELNSTMPQDVDRTEQIVGVGKKLYDIAKTSQSIVANVGALFGSASGNEGDYTDHDGKTYNLYQAQNRPGTAGRDIINTGYKNDTVRAGAGNDRISTLVGDDKVYGGEGRNVFFTGAGNDLLVDGSGDGTMSAGGGDDTIHPGEGNDVIESGTGHDTIVYDVRDTGNDLVVDPSRSGVVKFTEHAIDEISLRKDRYDLEIILPTDTGRNPNTVKLVGYFEQDTGGWEIIDRHGNHYGLYELTGRLTSYEALEVAFRDRGEQSVPAYPADIVHSQSVTDTASRFTVHIAEDRRLANAGTHSIEAGLVLTFEGNSSLDGWLTRNGMASLEAANELLTGVSSHVSWADYDRVTLIGVGEGGLIAQWFGAAASVNGPSFVNQQLINTPDVSGLISQVVRDEFPEYTQGFPVLATNYLANANDWVSKIGVWAGNDETYATWKAWDFAFDASEDSDVVTSFADVQAAHSPQSNNIDFADLKLSDLTLSHVRGVVSFASVADFDDVHANAELTVGDEVFDSTVNARVTLIHDTEYDDTTDDFVEATKPMRDAFIARLKGDSSAVDAESPWSVKLDFQPEAQRGEHLADGHLPVTEATLFFASSQATHGWESTSEGLKAGTDTGRATSLERDSVMVKDGTFIVNLPSAGTYDVSITVGHRERIQESLQISLNGYASDRVSTMPGDFLTRTYQVNTLDDQLRIDFLDLGGKHEYTAITGLTVEHVNYRSVLPVSELLDNDPSIVILTPSYELPETNAAIEILKESLKAAATAVLTAGVGAVLGSTTFGTSIATGLGGTVGTAATATSAKIATGLSIKAGMIAGFKAPVGSAVKGAVFNSLISSVPQNFVTNPAARGILSGGISIFSGVDGIRKHGQVVDTITNKVTQQRDLLGQIQGGLTAINGALTAANGVLASARGEIADHNVAPWVYDVVSSVTQMSQRYRLGKLDTGFVPVKLSDVTSDLAKGKSPLKVLKRWNGSRQFLVLDWVPKGEKLDQVSKSEHNRLVKQGIAALNALVSGYVEQLQAGHPDAQLDLLLISHGAGYDINRGLVKELNSSDIADALDYVKLVTLDPVSLNQDSLTWYHPEFTTIVDRIDNYFQTENTPDGSLHHGGQALDGRLGGGAAGMYNRQARIFDLATANELLRFRHWDTNELRLSTAELTDIEFSPDGRLVAAAGKDGIVTVRFVEDVPNPDPNIDEPLHHAGDMKFEVWGHESIVRSVAFMEMEVEGEWKDYLLTISAARNKENGDIDKNKVLLTDVETGLPVWQGKDVQGTQVEASPSGNVIVSADGRGHAKIWKRVEDTVTFAHHGELVEAHPGGAYIADVLVINDAYFVTAGVNGQVKLFEITEDGGKLRQAIRFDNDGQGKVRNLDYDQYNGLLAVASGREVSFWRFDQETGRLSIWAPKDQPASQIFGRQDHEKAVQGVAFSKPAFLLNEDGKYTGDRHLPRTELGDVNLAELDSYLAKNKLSDSLDGLKLLTGGEDRTLFLYSLDDLDSGVVREERVLSGSMLPIREVTLSADGQRVAVVGQDNIDGNLGGPIRDEDFTDELDDRLGWKFSELFLRARREHNALPLEYIYQVVEENGESFFWLRNSGNANRPGSLARDRNDALPPHKRDRGDGIDFVPVDLYVRPGQSIPIEPRRFLIEVDKSDYIISQAAFASLPMNVTDDDGQIIGTLRQRKVDGKLRAHQLVFEAADDLDFSAADRREFTGTTQIELLGPADENGDQRSVKVDIVARVINHKPVLYRDVVNLHPNRSEPEFHPKLNDYDFDNDDFNLYQFPTTWQPLTHNDEVIARYRKTKGKTNAIEIETVVDANRLEELLSKQAANTPDGETPSDFLSLTFEYQVREVRYKAMSKGTVEVRVQMQAGPTNLRKTEVGADQFVLNWEPVSWSASKYVIQRFDEAKNEWVKHTEVSGRKSDSKLVKGLTANTNYWFRVVAVNESSGRRHASHEGTSVGGFPITTPGYEAVGTVTTEVLSAKQIQVTWTKVYWDVAKYEVQLHKLLVGEDGNLVTNEDGSYRYDTDGPKPHDVIPGQNNGRGLSRVFKQLEPDTWYLAEVTAKSKNASEPKLAAFPVSTTNRLLPGALNVDRLGPEKVRIDWSKVEFADHYRIVAIDPSNPLSDARVTTGHGATPGNSGTRTETLTGLQKDTEYVVFVEVRDRHKNWSSILPTEDGVVRVLDNTPVAAGESQIDLTSDLRASSKYLLPNDFSTTLRLPTSDGAFVGTEGFQVFNVAHGSVTVEAMEGETVNGAKSLTLPPAIGPNLDVNNAGILVYRFVRTLDGWTVDISNDATDAIRVKTPVFLPAEPGSFQRNDEKSLPKRLHLNWESPFWNVSTHQVKLYEAVLNEHREPIASEDGYVLGREVDKTSKIDVKSGDLKFGREFRGLEVGKWYVAELITRGPDGEFREQIKVQTEAQDAPDGVDAEDIGLREFTVVWNKVEWNAGAYRVRLEVLDANGNVVPDSLRFEKTDEKKSRLKIDGLQPGRTYRYTVEVRNGELEWIGNSDIHVKTVKTARFALPENARITLADAGNKSLTIDWSNTFAEDADGNRFAADNLRVKWTPEVASIGKAGQSKAQSGDKSVFQIPDLVRDAAYNVSVEFTAKIDGVTLTLPLDTTRPFRTAPMAELTLTVPEAEVDLKSFRVNWSHAKSAGDGLDFYNVRISKDGGQTWHAAWNGERSGMRLPTSRSTFLVKGYETDADKKPLKTGTNYIVRLAAVYEEHSSRNPVATENVTTASLDTAPARNLRASDIGRKSATILWDAPNPAWDVTAYDVRLNQGETEVLDSYSRTLKFDFKDLKPDTTYRAVVTAKNNDLNASSDPVEVTFTTLGFRAPVLSGGSTGPQTVALSWSHDGDGVKEFKVLKRSLNGDWVVLDKNVPASARSVTITGKDTRLVPGKTYPFMVRAKYATESRDSNVVDVKLMDATPARNVQAKDIGRTSATIQWDAPSPAWDITAYDVNVYEGSSLKTDSFSRTTQFKANNLKPDTQYRVVVTAKNNDLGASSQLAQVTFRTLGFSAPQLSGRATGPQSVFLSWSHDGDGVQKFTIRKQTQSGAWVDVKSVPASARSVTITGKDTKLIPGRTYPFKVTVAFASGSRESNVASVKLMDATPARNVQAKDIGRTSATIQWDAPSPAWDITAYDVNVYEGSSLKTDSFSRTTQFKANNLKPDTQYRVVVTAKNNDLGASSQPVQVIFRTLGFSAPQLSGRATGPQSVFLSWSHDGDGVQEFKILKQSQNGVWVVVKGVPAGARSVTITGNDTKLIPGRTYPFKVRAKYASETPDSNVASVKLLDAAPARNLRVTFISKTKATIQWDSPNPTWDVSAYDVKLYIGSKLKKDSFARDNDFHFKDLKANTTYRAVVTAKNNDLGVSTPAIEVTFTTLK